MIKFFTSIFILVIFTSCGFKPIYKLSDNNQSSTEYYIEITNQVSREIVEEINENIFQDRSQKYKALLTIHEDLTPSNTYTNAIAGSL